VKMDSQRSTMKEAIFAVVEWQLLYFVCPDMCRWLCAEGWLFAFAWKR
jgi:hypothetical protein